MSAPLSGAEELRRTVALLNNCREDFNDRFTPAELLLLGRAYRACGWDIPPDRWDPRQIRQCLDHGRIPCWGPDERPSFPRLRQHVPMVPS